MKKLLLISALIISVFSFAQIPVTDATANSQLALQVTNAGKQLTQLENTYKALKKANEKFQQVNGFVQQAGHLQNIINEQKQAIKAANQLVRMAGKRKLNMNGVSQNLSMISGSIKTVQALLRNGVFQMNDSERLDRLEKEYDKVSQYNSNIKVKLIQSSFR